MTPLTDDPTPDWNPQWSPDGSEIMFFAYRSGSRDLWVMPSSGGPARQLTSQPGFEWFQRWSPNGREVAFARPAPDNSVAIVSAAGGEPTLVTSGADPAWSPDGQWLVFRKDAGLFRIARDGRSLTPLPTSHQPQTPRFSRDGQSIYFSVVQGPSEHHDIWRLSLRDGKTTRLTRFEGRRGALGYYFAVDARYFYFTWREHEGDIWVMNVATDDRK
jgi:Tol biopolymer transport system component